MNAVIIETINKDGNLVDGIFLEGQDEGIDLNDDLLLEEDINEGHKEEGPFYFDTIVLDYLEVPQDPPPPSDDDVSS